MNNIERNLKIIAMILLLLSILFIPQAIYYIKMLELLG
ncbi:hypothetical protein LCGC14_2007550 [marine sediment metagenome]|uniref:Uncharacterized protein n=1 Tax=marine sediment metagenome TaxID=412755 RepID=A0A0F9FNT8_9ZZZZ